MSNLAKNISSTVEYYQLMAEEPAEQMIEDWKTGAFFLAQCLVAAFFSGILFSFVLGPLGGLLGFFLGGIAMFLLISRKVYG
jgi:hypothetical protein